MDFALNDIQEMLKDSATKFVQNDYGFETRQKHSASELGYSEKNWQLFAELGWLALPFSEEFGGLDGTAVDLMVLMQALGKGLIVEPYLSTVVLAGNFIQRHGSAQQKENWIPQIAGGELKMALAACETASQRDVTLITTTATKTNGNYVLNGTKPVVLHGQSADVILVAARTFGEVGEQAGISVFAVDPAAQGVTKKSYITNDGGRACDLTLNNVQVDSDQLVGEEGSAAEAIQAVINDAIIAVSAEAVGLMEKLQQATVEYTQVRKQFDVPIARFQVLQHRMVDMFVEVEQARSMLYFGAINLASGNTQEANRAIAMLKVKIGSASRLVGQTAVQLHGGMGVTEELDVGHMFKRTTMINTLFGSHDSYLDSLVKARQAS